MNGAEKRKTTVFWLILPLFLFLFFFCCVSPHLQRTHGRICFASRSAPFKSHVIPILQQHTSGFSIRFFFSFSTFFFFFTVVKQAIGLLTITKKHMQTHTPYLQERTLAKRKRGRKTKHLTRQGTCVVSRDFKKKKNSNTTTRKL